MALCLSEQTFVVYYLHSINRFVFIMAMECAYCVVQTESLLASV